MLHFHEPTSQAVVHCCSRYRTSCSTQFSNTLSSLAGSRVKDVYMAVSRGRLPVSTQSLQKSLTSISNAATSVQVVLVNNGTASASELLAGALHDAADIPLIGERTFGKGVTQRVVPLSDDSILLVSTASYMTPKRVPVHKVTAAVICCTVLKTVKVLYC